MSLVTCWVNRCWNSSECWMSCAGQPFEVTHSSITYFRKSSAQAVRETILAAWCHFDVSNSTITITGVIVIAIRPISMTLPVPVIINAMVFTIV